MRIVADLGIPARPGDVTPRWLTAALRACGALAPGGRIAGAVSEAAGTGQMRMVRRHGQHVLDLDAEALLGA
jgi:hypothetical protein